jgi:tRNA nucleotidyltransferase (CCA-adding enzyme)
VVGATPEDLLEQGYRQVGRDFPVFLHPDSGEEYALARTERKAGRGHTGFEVHSDPSVTLEQDLLRRDLTVNAIAESPDGELIDPYGGKADLEARLLRHVSPAFVEDPLRVLRVARFAAYLHALDFQVADDTLSLMRSLCESGELETLSAERIWSEMARALQTPNPGVFLEVLDACGASRVLLPELTPLAPALACLRQAATDSSLEVRFAALCSGLDGEAVETLCQRLNAPRRFAELAGHWARQEPALLAPAELTAAERLQVLEATDAFRRPERFALLLDTLKALHPDADDDYWRRALDACQGVDAAAIAASGIPGHEVGKRLRAEREQLLGD